MVYFDRNTKNLVLPSSLGNFPSNGGGSGITPEEVQEMITSAITAYDEGIQEEFNETNAAVGDNADNIEALSGSTAQNTNDISDLSGATEQNAEDISNLSGATAEIEGKLGDFATTATTSAITAQVEELSGATANIEQSLENYATTAVTSGISGQLEELSASTQGIESQLGDFATTGDTNDIAQDLEELSGVTSGIAEDLAVLSAYTATIPTGSTGGGGDYIVVDALSAITSPKEGMKAYVNPVGLVMDRMTAISIYNGMNGWSGGLSGFDGADLDYYVYGGPEIISMQYNPNIDYVQRYWQMAATGVYTKYEEGCLKVIWDSTAWPNATAGQWNDDYWLPVQQGQFIADTRDEAGRTYIYKGGAWVEDKKMYYLPDLRVSSALTKNICDRTSTGEMDIQIRFDHSVYSCTNSSANNWSIGETSFKTLIYDNGYIKLWRLFSRWNEYTINNDSQGQVPSE